jgi:hypothetical protein
VKAQAGSRLALGALLLFVAGRCLVPMDETDLFFNLRLGELVLAGGTVPRTNLLSFTFPDFRDVNLAWLFQIVLALSHRAGGIAGTVLLKTGFVLATFVLLFRVALRRGAHPAAAAAALALCAWAAEPRFVERPHLCTFLGLAFVLLALERAEAGRPRALWALVPLGLVWANANSCFFLAPVVLLLYAAGAWMDKGKTDARRAALLALCLLPLVLATPSGTGALSYIANHWRMPWVRPLQEYRVAEWPLDGPFFLAAGGVVLAAALPGRRLRDALPALALAALGSRRIRFAAEAALLAGPILALLLTRLVAHLARRVGARWRLAATTVVVAALAGLTLAPRLAAARRGERLLDLGLEPDLVPVAAIQFTDGNGLGDRMYNDLEVGSYLTWHSWPSRRVFQDPRINGYPEDFHAILRRADLTGDEWEALLARFAVTTALITYPDLNPRAALFDPARWALVYRAHDGLVFAARRPEFAALIARAELPVTFSYTPDEGAEAHPLAARPTASPVPDCEWQRRLGDVLVETYNDPGAAAAYRAARAQPGCLGDDAQRAASLALGDVALRLHDPATAAAAYAGIELPRAHRNRGLALLALGRDQEALDELRAALASDPNDADTRRAEGIARARLSKPSGP